MAKQCTIRFLPGDVSVKVEPGTTILAAATRAGVFINSVCGGDVVCGRCRVIVREGNVDEDSPHFLTREEVREGYVLACEARVASDAVVEVPPETRLHGEPVSPESQVPYLADISRLLRWKTRLTPLVRKTYLELSPPDLDNNLPDLERLEHALRKTVRCEAFQTSLPVARDLPGALRRANWRVTVLTAWRGPVAEIIAVEPGDTTDRHYCVAADIGTTTVVCHLVDLTTGRTFGQAARYNSQARHGADVIRRIIYASRGAEQERQMREAIVSDVNELVGELCETYDVTVGDISLITAAGNTTMIHMLLGLPVENIRREPYVGAAYHVGPVRAAEAGLRIHPRGMLYCLPSVAGFVGADISAGIFATGLAKSDELRMLLDVGTNGEIAIGNRDFLVCASASAGPAFEGAECSCGMRATDGAIDHLRLSPADGSAECSTVSLARPVGICGTGFVDLVAEMLRIGLIDKTGRIHPEACPARVREDEGGQLEFVVVPAEHSGSGRDIVVTQADVHNILRAKGAIYAATSVLLKALSMTFDDLAEIMVAGAFGSFLNISSAVFIGLLPDVPRERLRFVGNTSLAGAKLAGLSHGCYEEVRRIASACTYIELSTHPSFMDEFVAACFFPHTRVELFPTVLAELQPQRER